MGAGLAKKVRDNFWIPFKEDNYKETLSCEKLRKNKLARLVNNNYYIKPNYYLANFVKDYNFSVHHNCISYGKTYFNTHNLIIFATKNHYNAKADINLINNNLEKLAEWLNTQNKNVKVYLPLLGCGMGKYGRDTHTLTITKADILNLLSMYFANDSRINIILKPCGSLY